MRSSIYTTWPLYLSVVLLILNDHVFKYLFPGLLVGKLSDVAGIFLIVLVFRALFPDHPRKISITIITLFAYWKSQYSQSLIDLLNTYSPMVFVRIVDYSDLVALVMIPIAHHVYERREKYAIKVRITGLLKIPVVILTVVGITGTSVMLPHHKYEIRKESPDQSIDIGKAIELIENIANSHDLQCVVCDPTLREGLFEDKEIKLSYRVLDNDRGIRFDIKGEPGGPIIGSGSWKEMDLIKQRLQNSLGNEFQDMEFVIRLGQR